MLTMLPLAPAVPVTVNVTEPPLGRFGITIPAPCISAAVVLTTVGHAAAPVGSAQFTPVTLRLATAGSVKMALSAGLGPALLTTIVYVTVAPALALAALSVLVMPRLADGVTCKVSVAAAALLPPLTVVKAPAAIVFSQEPTVVLVTVTVTVQLSVAGIVPPASATEVPFAAAVTVPPQVVAAAGTAALVI